MKDFCQWWNPLNPQLLSDHPHCPVAVLCFSKYAGLLIQITQITRAMSFTSYIDDILLTRLSDGWRLNCESYDSVNQPAIMRQGSVVWPHQDFALWSFFQLTFLALYDADIPWDAQADHHTLCPQCCGFERHRRCTEEAKHPQARAKHDNLLQRHLRVTFWRQCGEDDESCLGEMPATQSHGCTKNQRHHDHHTE